MTHCNTNTWKLKDNMLTSPCGISWAARCGGLVADKNVPKHKKTDGRWLPLPHDNSHYMKIGDSPSPVVYTIQAPYSSENLLRTGDQKRMDFIMAVSHRDNAFCQNNLNNTLHKQKIQTDGKCDCFNIKFGKEYLKNKLKESMAAGHTWFVPLKLPQTPDVGRNGFGIHPDGGEPGTQGCIGIVAGDIHALYELLKKSIGQKLEVIGSSYWWQNPPHSNM